MKLAAEVGIDLGTSNVRVFRASKGVVLEEPTVVAINTQNGQLVGFGTEAREMLGRTPGNVQAVRPLRDGVIADYTVTCKMLEAIKRKVIPPHQLWIRPSALISIPSAITNVERRAVVKAAHSARFGRIMTIEEPMAAAIGAGLPIEAAGGNMIVNIGGGTTDVSVISLGGIVLSQSIRVAGVKIDEAIIRYIRAEHELMIGDQTAEEIKITIGSAWPLEPELSMEVRGRDVDGGLPRTISVTSIEIRNAIEEPIRQITDKICDVLEETPPELASDIIERGITLSGGGALLKNLDRLISSLTHIPARVADNALLAVTIGTGRALDELPRIIASGAVTRFV